LSKAAKPNNSIAQSIQWLSADLSDSSSLQSLIDYPEQISHVVFCAAPNERTESAYRSIYVNGLKNLLAALRSRKQAQDPPVLFVSSTAVYDAQAQGLFNEDSPTQPRGFNGQVLLEAETWLLAQWPTAIVLRLSGIYGPNRQTLLQSIKNGTATMPQSPDYCANRIHVEDAARAVLHLLSGGHDGIYIGTDSHPMALRALYGSLAQMMGAPDPKLGAASPMMGKKRLSNEKLLSTGFKLNWPDSLMGYRAILNQDPSGDQQGMQSP
jgi:nucleoside-diphosphate-sugar epimerase